MGRAISALANGLEESFRRRLAALPAETRLLLLIAAADPLGEPTIVWRAAERLGIGRQRGRLPKRRGCVSSAPVSSSGIRSSGPPRTRRGR